MPANALTRESLITLAASIEPRQGWNFSRLETDRDPVPWAYEHVVTNYLHPGASVLDIGTGGGEQFTSFASYFGSGVGIDNDPDMIAAARQNAVDHLRFEVMDSARLRFDDDSFDVVLCRQAPFASTEVARVLRPGGTFVTQQVGPSNTENVFNALGWDSNRAYLSSLTATTIPSSTDLRHEFEVLGFEVLCAESYNVPFYFRTVESFVFWLKSVPIPMPFDDMAAVEAMVRFIGSNSTPRGIETNEQRDLLVVRRL